MYCTKCGATLPPNSIYCPYCGAKAVELPQQATPPPSPITPQPIARPPAPPKPTVEPIPFTKKVSGALLKPRKTFEHIGLIQDLKGPSLILLIQGIILGIATFTFFSKLQWTGELPGFTGINGMDTQAFMDAFMAFFTPIFTLMPVFAMFIGWVVMSAIYWVVARILGGSGSFRGTMTVYGYASIPRIFTAILGVAMSLLSAPLVMDLSNLGNLSDMSSLYLLPPVFLILNQILNDALEFWVAILLSLGLQYNHNLSQMKAFGIGIGIWAILLIINIVPTWLFL